MNPQPKPKRIQDAKYRAFIRSQQCCIKGCWNKPVQVHHTKAGGMGTKCSDYLSIPLCALHHYEHDAIGKKSFPAKYGLDYGELIKHYNNLYRNKS